MDSKVTFVLLVVVGVFHQSDGLSCFCERKDCGLSPVCPGGLVKDQCGCCDVCAKQKGEQCGGPWGIEGTCDKGLKCNKGDDFNAIGQCMGDIKPVRLIQEPPSYARLIQEPPSLSWMDKLKNMFGKRNL